MDLMEVTWLACDLKSGQIRGELPLPTQRVRRMIAREETMQWTLPVDDPSCPDDWATMTVPGFSMIVMCLDDVPTLAWAVLGRDIGTDGVTLRGTTLEHCFARRNVATLTGDGYETLLLYLVVLQAAVGFGFTPEWDEESQAIGYIDTNEDEDVSCLAVLQDRVRAKDAPEWRIRIGRSGGRILKAIEIQSRIGQIRPDVVFELDDEGRGNVATYTRATSYGPNEGATVVRAVSDGSGGGRPMSSEHRSVLLDSGWPAWEARPTFPLVDFDASSVADEDAELERLAVATLAQREHGTVTWQITGDANAPKPGVDYAEGDTVTIQIAPQGKRDPYGGTAQMRVLGWDLDPESGQTTLIAWEEPS